MPAMGLSLILVAVGAILLWGVSVAVSGVAIPTVGAILLVVGIIGLVFSLLFMMSFSPFGTHDRTVQ